MNKIVKFFKIRVSTKRICAFSGAPRPDVINVGLCRQVYSYPTTQGKAFCSCKTAPTLKSSSKFGYQQKKVYPKGIPFFVAQRRGFEPPVTFPQHTISNRAP